MKETEIWKDIEGYEGYYQISNLGKVKSLKRISLQNHALTERILKPSITTRGYLYIGLHKKGKGKKFNIHRLVAKAFCEGYKEGFTVDHDNNIKTDNNASNLKWMTHVDNMKKAWKDGLFDKKGEKNGQSKLTESDVIEIRKQRGIIPQNKLGKKYLVDQTMISCIQLRKNWKHVPQKIK